MELLEKAKSALPLKDVPCLPEQIPGWVRTTPFEQLAACDRACAAWIENGVWPQVAPDEAAEIFLRLSAACDLAPSVLESSDSEDMGVNELAEMLLVRFWHEHGIEWADHSYGSKAGSGS